MIWKYLNWLNGTYWRLEYAMYLIEMKGITKPYAIRTAKRIKNKREYYLKILMYIPIGEWREFTQSSIYESIQLNPIKDFGNYIILLSILVTCLTYFICTELFVFCVIISVAFLLYRINCNLIDNQDI